MRRPILNHSEAGELVYDPFLGSGSTLMAAEETGRVCYGIEIDARYVDAIVQRWQKRSGKPAVRQGDGRRFDDLQQERGASQVEEVSFDVAA
jgi:DNA modification methylase